MQHIIPFDAYTNTQTLSEFLLDNRHVKVIIEKPKLESVLVTMNSVNTVKPFHVVSLACLLEEYYIAGISILFAHSTSDVYAYMQNIGFTDMWAKGKALKHTGFTPVNDPTAFAVWKADPTLMTDYVNSAYSHYKYSFFREKDIAILTTYLTEIFNNVFDHAFAKGATTRTAFGMLQYYPRNKRLFISVSDFGMGIPASVNRFLRDNQLPELSPPEALYKARTLGFSSQSRPHNKGLGLDTLRTGLTSLRGTLTIQTSQAIYHVSRDGKETIYPLPGINFPGTTVNIKIFYNGLSEHEPDEIQDEATLF
ncbi:hypothetical protein [Hymenobacter sediminicola]|uniref:Uncharacterized protein n=1 Tax=Hymenobacter sediminicola TaxID=2761579 RepID=A0A7G7W755_9BACT|nr:hypothetical protein [Hymenobacter sediminicola]QNH62198.1 hypothetical protein H4317_19005 [Hymenobacter sediminicola]